MFNLLRMDLYRAKRSRSLYVCMGLLLLAAVMVYGLVWLIATPQGQNTAIHIVMLTAEEGQELQTMLDEVDSLVMFRQIGLDGGLYNITFGIWVILFVCMDHQSGFMKNIMALHQNRWGYIGSKLLTAAIVDILYLVIQYAFVLVLNAMFGNMVPYTKIGDVLFYLSWAWLLTTAFAGLMIMVCVCSRSVAAGTLAAVLLGGGVVVVPLERILSIFHAGGWLKHTIYLSLAMGPDRYTMSQDLKVYAVGAVFLVIYPVLAGLVLKREDI